MGMSRLGRRAAVTAAIAVVTLVVAGVAISTVGRARFEKAKERFVESVGPLEWSAFQSPELSEDLNAATWLLAGAETLVIGDGDIDTIRRFLSPPMDEIPMEEQEAVQRLVEINGEAFDLLARSAGLYESSFGIDYERGSDAEMPPHLQLFLAGRLVRADGRLALMTGDTGRLARDLEVLDQMATVLFRESTLVAVLFGFLADRDFLLMVRDILENGIEEAGTVEDLASRLESRDRTEALRRSFAAEGALLVSTPLRQLLGEDLGLLRRTELALFEPYQRASLLDGYSDLAGAVDRPWVEIRRNFAPRPPDEPQAPWDVHWFMLPNILSAVEQLKANTSSSILAREAVELRRVFLADGAVPGQAGFGTDDPYTGEPFRFETAEDGSVTLTAPGADELWREENPFLGEDRRPVFTWRSRASRAESLNPAPGAP